MIEIHCAFRIYSTCRKPTYAFLIITLYFCCIPSLSLPVVRIFIYTHPTPPYQGSSCGNFFCSYRYYVTYWRTLHRRTNYFPQSSLKRYGMEITFERPFHSNGQTRTHSHIHTRTHTHTHTYTVIYLHPACYCWRLCNGCVCFTLLVDEFRLVTLFGWFAFNLLTLSSSLP